MPTIQFSAHTLLIFHGSARESAGKAAAAFTEILRQSKGCSGFSTCFLRGAEPDLDTAIANAIDAGYKILRLLPLFLLPGAHTSEDIPAVVAKFSKNNPDILFEVSDCLVQNPQFIEFVASQITRE